MASFASTRDYNDVIPTTPENITSGILNLIYPASTGGSPKTYATVNFDLTNDGIGLVMTTEGKELLWNQVSTAANNSFTLDNIPLSYTTDLSNPITVSFSQNDSPYSAGLLSEGNDLLWGTAPTSAANPKAPVEIELHHKMSLLRVVIDSEIDLSDAIVEISGIVKSVSSFHRTTGKVTVGTNKNNYNYDLRLVEKGNDKLAWAEKNLRTNESESNKFTTRNFIIPPQPLQETNDRSQLKVFVNVDGEDKVYSGYLPRSMSVQGYEGEDGTAFLEFLSEKFLTIKTTIEAKNPILEFQPVTYVDWVNKGKFVINGYQEGLYDSSNFTDLISAITSNDVLAMSRFGYEKNGEWHFQVWADLELSYEDIENKLKNVDIKFDFIIGAHTITIKKSDGSVITISQENDNLEDLVDILTGAYNG